MKQPEVQPKTGILYLVATPIGNLEDISHRAQRVLSEVQLIAAEDTRVARKLLSGCGIESRAELISYREQNHERSARRLVAHLAAGRDAALVSDAGTPGVSDPGSALVAAALAQGLRVVPVPGPTAAVVALCAAGLATDRFLFLGFPPRKEGALRRLAQQLRAEPGSLVFYESPHRLGRTLALLAEELGSRPAVVARELTKLHEQFDRGLLPELAARWAEGCRGEVVLVVSGAPDSTSRPLPVPDGDRVPELVAALRAGRRLPASDIARMLAPITGRPRRELYQLASATGGDDDGGREPDDEG